MTVVVDEQGQVLRTSEGADLRSGGPFQRSVSGRPTIAQSSVPFALWGDSSMRLLSGRTVSFTQIYRTQPWVGVAVNKIARLVASLPLKVYRRNSQGDRERVHDHPLVDLIQRPAPRASAAQLKQWMVVPALVHGNSTLMMAREGRGFGPPTRLWPLDWRYMSAQILESRIEFWESSETGSTLRFDPADILHFSWEAPDGRIGVSPLQQLGTSIRIEASAQEYQESYLTQGARPPSGITLPPGMSLDRDQRAEMRADIAEVYAGSRNAGRPALLPAGVEWKSIAHNAVEAELIEQRKLTRDEVGAIYGVSLTVNQGVFAGTDASANRSTVSQSEGVMPIRPWLTLAEETFKAQVIDPEPAFQGLFVEFDLAEILKEDKLREVSALKIAVQSGLLTINEARRIQNRKAFPMDWCDKPLIPSNNLSTAPSEQTSDGGRSNGNGALEDDIAAAAIEAALTA